MATIFWPSVISEWLFQCSVCYRISLPGVFCINHAICVGCVVILCSMRLHVQADLLWGGECSVWGSAVGQFVAQCLGATSLPLVGKFGSLYLGKAQQPQEQRYLFLSVCVLPRVCACVRVSVCVCVCVCVCVL